jgi:galactokinase
MDQFISCFGQSGHALLLDCRSLEYELLPLNESARIVICNSNVKHELVSGEYNRRRGDCEAGVAYLRQYLPNVRALRDVTPEQLEQYGTGMPEVTFRRCRHVVTENARALAAAEALKSGDLERFGNLMFQSHRSLQLDYEVSCAELDMLVDLAQQQSGVLGARMTGGGFGGCTVNLVAAEHAQSFGEILQREYHNTVGLEADIYVCTPSDGASELAVQPT